MMRKAHAKSFDAQIAGDLKGLQRKMRERAGRRSMTATVVETA